MFIINEEYELLRKTADLNREYKGWYIADNK